MTLHPCIAENIEEKIRNYLTGIDKGWGDFHKLPTVKELSSEFGASPSTIDKILRTLKAEGLITSRQGKGYYRVERTHRQVTHTIGVLIYHTSHIDHPVMIKRLAGIQKTLFAASFHMKLFTFNPACAMRAAPVPGSPSALDLASVDAIINHCEAVGEEQLCSMALRKPVVCMEWRVQGVDIGCVRQDYAGGGVLMARHLLDRGYRDIALLTLGGQVISAAQQTEGFRLGLLGSGARLEVIEAEDWTMAAARKAVRRWLDGGGKASALACGADELAAGAYEELRGAGLDVPGDLALSGWNDTGPMGDIPVPLTTVRMPFQEGGRRAAEEILRLLEAPGRKGNDILLPAGLVVRDSTPPR